MYNGKKISVAMATYNGEKFIEEQLLSILNQTVLPDEIVISDDGSKDKTLEIVNRIAANAECEIAVMTDNPHHGFVGNFEWAMLHTTGEYIFLSDQDDVFLPEKFEKMLEVFEKHLDAECVIHNGTKIDGEGNSFRSEYDDVSTKEGLQIPEGDRIRIERDIYLTAALSWGGPRGMSMCVKRSFFDSAYPFYGKTIGQDAWLSFCSILNNTCYYLNLPLAKHRTHSNNVSPQPKLKREPLKSIKRKIKALLKLKSRYYGFMYKYYMKDRMERLGYCEHPAYKACVGFCEIAEKMYDAETSSRLRGAVKLCSLYHRNPGYKLSGRGQFIYELMYILRYSQNYRREAIKEMREMRK